MLQSILPGFRRLALSLCTVFALAVGDAAAQAGQFHIHGRGCNFAGEKCRIDHVGLPQAGATFDITYTGPNGYPRFPRPRLLDEHPHLALGFWSTLPTLVPPHWFPMQPADCLVHVDALVVVPSPLTFSPPPNLGYADRIRVSVPTVPEVVGTVLFAQWWTIVSDAYTRRVNALVTSDAAILIVGA